MRQSRNGFANARRFAIALLVLAAAMAAGAPSWAVPAFSAMYGVSCTTCHTVAPQLNSTGQAFQANLFRWATSEAGGGLPRRRGLTALPVSGIVTADRVSNSSLHITTPTRLETLELFAADSFTLDARRNGGYFIDLKAAIKDARGGDLDAAWAATPIAGRNGQLAVTVGQFSPMMYQYDPINSLTVALPVALTQGTDGVAFSDPTPGIRLDFYDNRGKGTADGNYLALGLPFQGHLALNKDSRLYDSNGVFLHGFRRQGIASLGAFGYVHDSSHQVGLLGTVTPLPSVNVLAAATSAHNPGIGNSRGYSLEADWTALSGVALTGRMEWNGGFQRQTYPVAAINYFPFKEGFLRLSAETIQQKGNRQTALYAYLLF